MPEVGGTTWIRGDRVAEGLLYCAVDVGTSRTSAAIAEVEAGGVAVRAARLGQAGDAASSAVFVTADDVLHGDIAERRGAGEPARLVRDYTRRIGDDVPLTVAGRTLRAEELYARTVEWAVREATGGRPPAGVSVTVPATWGAHRRGLVRAAIAARGLADPTVLSEPEAAVHHYAATHGWEPGAVLAVYELGGGSFDLAFVRVGETPDQTRVLHTAGIPDLGGADFDDAVIAHVLASAGPLAADGTPVALAALRRECVAAKEALSFDAETIIPVLLGGAGGTVRLVRSEFEAMIEPALARTVAAFDAARAAAGVATDDVAAVLLSGGSTRIPQVAQLLSEHLDLPLCRDADPKAVVALGAVRARAEAAAAVSASVTALEAAGTSDLAAWLASLESAPLAGVAAGDLVSAPAIESTVVAAEAPTPVTTVDARMRPHPGTTLPALHPQRWRMVVTGTAAAAALVGGAAFSSAVATAQGTLPTAPPAALTSADGPSGPDDLTAYAGVQAAERDPAPLPTTPPEDADPTDPPAGDPAPGAPAPNPFSPIVPTDDPLPPPDAPAQRLERHVTEAKQAEEERRAAAEPSTRPGTPSPRTSSAPRPTASATPRTATGSPSPTASASPSPTASASPSPTSEPTPTPAPTTPAPEPTSEPAPTTEPEPEPTTEPEPEPEPSPEPTAEPEPTTAPSPDPSPSADPSPTSEPAPDPTPTSEPPPPPSPGPTPQTSTAG